MCLSRPIGEQVAAYTQLGYRQPVCDVDYHPHEHMVALCSRGEGHPIQVYIYDAKGMYKISNKFSFLFSFLPQNK